jgi:predicted glycosyltransferase
VPRTRPGVEQLLRAQRMAARGHLRMLHPDELSPGRLLQALQTELQAWRDQPDGLALKRLDGLARVSAALFSLLGHRASGTPSSSIARPRRGECSLPLTSPQGACA